MGGMGVGYPVRAAVVGVDREATRYRLGALTEQDSLRAEAEARLRRRGVPSPRQLTLALVPGLGVR